MFRRLFLLFSAGSVLALRAQPGELVFSSDTLDATDTETRLIGHARIADGSILVTADEIRLDSKTRTLITAIGHVVATRGATRLLADHLTYHRTDASFTAEHVRLGVDPYYVAGDSASGTAAEITITHATLTYGEPGPWQPAMTAEKIIYAPNQRLRTENSVLGIGPMRFIPLPKLTQDLHDPFSMHLAGDGGFDSKLGAYVSGDIHLPTTAGVLLGLDTALYSNRGVMIGPGGGYSRGPEGADINGFFRTGYIDDRGNKGVDLLGRPVPENRAYVEWEHAQKLSDNLSLTAQVNWWKDSEVLRDFRPREFFPVQEPDTFAEATYAGKNYLLSAFVRAQPNNFDVAQERLPEIRFDLLPLAVGAGIDERFNASAAVLRETEPLGGPRLQSTRLDAYYALERPIMPTEWFAFTPIAGVRITHYADTVGAISAGNYTRSLGEIGFDTALHAAGTFDYKNALWGIDGLRHLLTPRLSYRYIPEADKGHAQIPQIDRETFSTYLQPLGLGDTRNLDDLHATNTLRLGLDNTIQTRDETYGSRDLLSFNLASDFQFKRTPGQRALSDVHTDVAFAPARWLSVDAYSRLTPQTGSLQEFNTGLKLHDGVAWSARISNNFLRHEIQDYAFDGRFRVNDRFSALTRLRYDARTRRFNEQAYGVVQDLDRTWRISYVVSLYSGPRRESHFGLNVQVEAISF